MKRLCIYLTYDKQKIVDKYIGYMLKELRTCVSRLIVVCNQKEIICGRDILEEYADEIFCRENIGFDAGGFKDALCDLIGWNKVLQYDELILVNDSMFGPFKPMKEIFTEMDEKPVDFWGLAKHGECRNRDIGYIPEHIQSYFLVVRSRMLHCSQFKVYWEEMRYYATFDDVVKQHEIRFTNYFSGLGYTFASLADTEINDSTNIANNYMQYGTISYELIKKRNYPFLKKQQIAYDTLFWQTQENLRQAINYIEKETDYDADLIWENLIRTMNMTDLQRSLHLQYLISADQELSVSEKTVLIVLITYPMSAEYVVEYLMELPSDIAIYIFAERGELLTDYKNQGMKCEIASFDRIGELLSVFCKYDFVCVLHDADMSSDVKPSCVGKSYFYNVWENLIKNREHVSGILKQFAKESYLGFLAPPQPNFGEYFGGYGRGWNGEFENVFQVVERLELHCQISEQLPPFRITDNFWIRGCILEKLKSLKPEEGGLLRYLPTFLAQDAGYYSGVVESLEYASMNEVNMQNYLTHVGTLCRRWCEDFHSVEEFFNEMTEKVFLGALWCFREKYVRILIYGAGELAQRYGRLLPEAEAYIVSDGQEKLDEIEGKPVRYLSQIPVSEDCGIVLCLNEKNRREVIPLLEKRGLGHYFCI